MVILEVEHLKKTYTTRLGSNRVEALRDVNFNVGKYVIIRICQQLYFSDTLFS